MIIVTGGAGFIGTNLVHSLLELNKEVLVVEELDKYTKKFENLDKLKILDCIDHNIFLKNLQLERYHDDIVLFVDTLEILLNAYSTQDELIEDIKEVIPEMKPAHRRILWKGIKKCLLCSDDRQNV